MKKNNKVSIIIPVFNEEKYITQCIDSAINQTYSNKEIIVIDDGSTDNSLEIIQKYNDIKIFHKENGGISSARNYGIDKATGEYIFFLDSDDLIEENTIEFLVNMLECKDLDIAHINLMRFKDEQNLNKEKFSEKETKIYNQYEVCKNILETKFISRVCGVLFKKSLFDGIKFPNDRYFEDLAVYYKILLNSEKIGINNAKLYKYRKNNNSITMKYSLKKCKDFVLSTNEMIKGITHKYNNLKEISNVVKIKNYIEIITMLNKKEDRELYNKLNGYVKKEKSFIKEHYQYFNKKDKTKIKLYFISLPLFMCVMKIYRKFER